MRKILVCSSVIGVFVVASPAAYAGGHGHGHGNHSQNHTCQGGHNCNTIINGDHWPRPRPVPKPTPPPPPKPAPAPSSTANSNSTSSSTSTSTTTVVVNNTTNVVNNVTVSAPAPASACACPAPVVKHRRAHRCRIIRVARYRKVWHHGRDCCGRRVSWYTYKKVHRKRRVCV
jgi:hypothetical protein